MKICKLRRPVLFTSLEKRMQRVPVANFNLQAGKRIGTYSFLPDVLRVCARVWDRDNFAGMRVNKSCSIASVELV